MKVYLLSVYNLDGRFHFKLTITFRTLTLFYHHHFPPQGTIMCNVMEEGNLLLRKYNSQVGQVSDLLVENVPFREEFVMISAKTAMNIKSYV